MVHLGRNVRRPLSRSLDKQSVQVSMKSWQNWSKSWHFWKFYFILTLDAKILTFPDKSWPQEPSIWEGGEGDPELVFDSANQFPHTQGPFIQNFIKICQLVGFPPSPVIFFLNRQGELCGEPVEINLNEFTTNVIGMLLIFHPNSFHTTKSNHTGHNLTLMINDKLGFVN